MTERENQVSNGTGVLYVIATPIGNLEDLSPRAARILREVDLIAAEDTRHSAPLLKAAGANARCLSLHEHNEEARTEQLLRSLRDSRDVALISDAGTPLISDPGFVLVRAAREAGFTVVPVPGPCALVCALSVAGLPTDRFVFEGFLPARAAARKSRLAQLESESRTLVFYESRHRIEASLLALREQFGAGRRAVLARELTKRFETVSDGTLAELVQWLRDDAQQQRGEFVVLVEGATAAAGDEADVRKLLRTLLAELPAAQAARLTARFSGRPRKSLYALALELSSAASDDGER